MREFVTAFSSLFSFCANSPLSITSIFRSGKSRILAIQVVGDLTIGVRADSFGIHRIVKFQRIAVYAFIVLNGTIAECGGCGIPIAAQRLLGVVDMTYFQIVAASETF